MATHHYMSIRVTIALPVYNGEDCLHRAIESIIGQTFRDFQLLLLDNCSTDSTADICLHYARLDSRITYVRNNSNVGPYENFSKGLAMAQHEYFCWLAHDDERHPEYLRELVTVLDQRTWIGMATSQVKVFHPDGTTPNLIKRFPTQKMNQSKYMACLHFLGMHHWWYSKADFIYGLYRTSLLKQDFYIPRLTSQDIGSDILFVYSYIAKHGCYVSDRFLLVRHSKYFFPEKCVESSFECRLRRFCLFFAFRRSCGKALGEFHRLLRTANRYFPYKKRVALNLLAFCYSLRLRFLFS